MSEKITAIEHCAFMLAKEISQRNVINVDEIKALIKTRINGALSSIMQEYSNIHEEEYIKAVKTAKEAFGTKDYVRLGLKVAELKQKRTAANRVMCELRKDKKYIALKDFVIERFGKEVYNEFVSGLENENHFPIASYKAEK
jgi:hypothetical protein